MDNCHWFKSILNYFFKPYSNKLRIFWLRSLTPFYSFFTLSFSNVIRIHFWNTQSSSANTSIRFLPSNHCNFCFFFFGAKISKIQKSPQVIHSAYYLSGFKVNTCVSASLLSSVQRLCASKITRAGIHARSSMWAFPPRSKFTY